MTVGMEKRLAVPFERLESRRRALLSRLEGLEASQLNRQPGPGRWSITQVLCHIISSEELSLGYVQKKMLAPERLRDAGLAGWLRLAALAAVLRSPLRFRAPAATARVPDAEDPATTLQRWDAVRDGWRELLESVPPELVDKALFRHPSAGRMSLPQALRFSSEHLRHHVKQVESLL
jgi:hypothetical protein